VLGEGIGLSQDLLSLRLALGFFVFELALVVVLAKLGGAEAMSTSGLERAIFEPVNEVVEGAGGGSAEGLKASDVGQARGAAQVLGEAVQAAIAQHQHQQQGAEHRDRVVGGAAPRRGRVEAVKVGGQGIEVDAEQEPGGQQPFRAQRARAATKPLSELLAQSLLVVRVWYSFIGFHRSSLCGC